MYLISAIAALGGVLFGFDLVIISGTVPFFTRVYQLNEFQTGWAVGCINLGAAIGALLAGKLSDSLGRQRLLMLCAVLFALTGAGTGWASELSAVHSCLSDAERGGRGRCGPGVPHVRCRNFARVRCGAGWCRSISCPS